MITERSRTTVVKVGSMPQVLSVGSSDLTRRYPIAGVRMSIAFLGGVIFGGTMSILYWLGALAVTIVVGVLAAAAPLSVPIAVAAIALLVVAARNANVLASVLLVAAVPFMRPFILGERLTPVSVILVAVAAGLSITADRQSEKMSPALKALVLWLSLLWAWALVLLILHPTVSIEITLRGIVGVPLAVVGACVVLREKSRRQLVIKGLLSLTILACVSYVITFALWQVGGYASHLIDEIPASYRTQPGMEPTITPLYAPLTTTLSAVDYSGVVIPRFLGLGREPGVMAALIIWAIFTVPRMQMRNSRLWIGFLVAGLVGTQSTAGFGIVLAVWVVTSFISVPDSQLGSVTGFARQVAGIGLLLVAGYLAILAPAFGFMAKQESNPASVGDRQVGTTNGLDALTRHPFGGGAVDPDDPRASGGINIIATTLTIGAVGTTLTLIAVTHPLVLSKRPRVSAGGTLAIVGVALTAQPLFQSTGFYLLIAMSVSTLISDPGEGELTTGAPQERDLVRSG